MNKLKMLSVTVLTVFGFSSLMSITYGQYAQVGKMPTNNYDVSTNISNSVSTEQISDYVKNVKSNLSEVNEDSYQNLLENGKENLNEGLKQNFTKYGLSIPNNNGGVDNFPDDPLFPDDVFSKNYDVDNFLKGRVYEQIINNLKNITDGEIVKKEKWVENENTNAFFDKSEAVNKIKEKMEKVKELRREMKEVESEIQELNQEWNNLNLSEVSSEEVTELYEEINSKKEELIELKREIEKLQNEIRILLDEMLSNYENYIKDTGRIDVYLNNNKSILNNSNNIPGSDWNKKEVDNENDNTKTTSPSRDINKVNENYVPDRHGPLRNENSDKVDENNMTSKMPGRDWSKVMDKINNLNTLENIKNNIENRFEKGLISEDQYLNIKERLDIKEDKLSNQNNQDENVRVCTMEYAPVCGVNGKTYSNSCNAQKSKVKISYKGVCKDKYSSNLDNRVEKLIEKKVNEFSSRIENNYDKTNKIKEEYKNVVEKIDRKVDQIESMNNINSSKKQLLLNVLDYVKLNIQEKIRLIEKETNNIDTKDILNDIFNS